MTAMEEVLEHGISAARRELGAKVSVCLLTYNHVDLIESTLRSMTGGRGAYSMEFSHYEEVPSHLAQKVVAEAKAEKEKAEKY